MNQSDIHGAIIEQKFKKGATKPMKNAESTHYDPWHNTRKGVTEKAVVLVHLVPFFSTKISKGIATKALDISAEEFDRIEAGYFSILKSLQARKAQGTLTEDDARTLRQYELAEQVTGISFDENGCAQCGMIHVPEELQKRDKVSMYDIMEYSVWMSASNTIFEILKDSAREEAAIIHLVVSGTLTVETASKALNISTAEVKQLVLEYSAADK